MNFPVHIKLGITTMVRVLISVLNWNNPQTTITCLRSIYQLTYPTFDVLVVDNASTDDSVEQIQATFPKQKIHVTDENAGFAGGHAIAVTYLQNDDYDALWILNNDTVIEADSLQSLVDAMADYGNLALYSSVPFQNRQTDEIAFASKFLRAPVFTENALRKHPPMTASKLFHDNKPQQVAALPGSCFFVPAIVIEKHGFMSEDFFLYGEEVDYCLRLGIANISCYIVPSSRVYHEREGSSKDNLQLRAVVDYYRTRNMIINSIHHNNNITTFIITTKQLVRVLILILQLLIRKPSVRLLGIKMTMRGIWDGIRQQTGKKIAPEDYLQHTEQTVSLT